MRVSGVEWMVGGWIPASVAAGRGLEGLCFACLLIRTRRPHCTRIRIVPRSQPTACCVVAVRASLK